MNYQHLTFPLYTFYYTLSKNVIKHFYKGHKLNFQHNITVHKFTVKVSLSQMTYFDSKYSTKGYLSICIYLDFRWLSIIIPNRKCIEIIVKLMTRKNSILS